MACVTETTTTVDPLRTDAGIHSLYRAVSANPRYAHYVRIPRRISKCLDYFRASYDRPATEATLHAYYLFIGVADDALDGAGLYAGEEILNRLRSPFPRFDEETKRCPLNLVTEIFKSHIAPHAYPTVLSKLEELYNAVLQEQQSVTITDYLRARRLVGHLTADISYLLIEPQLQTNHHALRSFFTEVGELGCLIDSLIDLRADRRHGLLNFHPSLKAHLKLATHIFTDGLHLILKRPRLLNVFLDAARDSLQDHFRRPHAYLAPAPALDL